MMYLENSEQATVPGERAAEAMLMEQCLVPTLPEAADSKGSFLVEYTVQTVSRDSSQDGACCNGHAESFEQYSAPIELFQSNQTPNEWETPGLSPAFDECALHRECLKPGMSSEHGANLSVAGRPCCEDCAEHLRVCRPCKPAGQGCDAKQDGLTVNCEHLGLCDVSDLITESADLQEHQDSEQCDMSDSPDSELCELEYTNDKDDDDDDEECEEHEIDAALSKDIDLSHFNTLEAEVEQDRSTVPSGDDDDEEEYDTALPSSDRTSEFYSEEDSFSDCSSTETKSFQTCPEGSIPSDHSFDSCGESEKGAHEDSGDEQTQWESFDDEEEQRRANTERNQKETVVVDMVIEDYFDLFDRSDYYRHLSAPKLHYISCFDGGDVQERLNVEEEVAILDANFAFREEVEVDAREAECDDTCDGDESKHEDWIIDEEDEGEGEEVEFPPESYEEEEEEEAEEEQEEDDGRTSDGHDDDIWDEEEEEEESTCRHLSNEESMSAPCAEDISVEGDAYEEEVCDDSSSLTGQKDDSVFIECSETEPYWWLVHIEGDGETCDSGVEDYFAYHIKSVESSVKQTLNGLLPKVLTSDLNSAASHESPKSGGVKCPSDIIHSIAFEGGDSEDYEESRDSEEEQSEDESPEDCDCEYCIPPTDQVSSLPLLPQTLLNDEGKICVVIDLDETLVHSSFKPMNNADFIIPVEIDGTVHQVYVLKRPHVDEFLKRMGEMFECVLFTASLSKYADPVSDLLDKWGAFRSRLFRESCVFHKGNYVKDLSRLGRDINKVIIIDNSPASYIFHPENAVPVASWFDDMSDTELLDLIPFFERLSKEESVYDFLKQHMTSS